MGYYSSPAVAALMAVFNIRLGWWLPNPADPGHAPDLRRLGNLTWKSPGPQFLLKWLAIELASATNWKRRYLNISDGGHFDNLGLYELVRRRCRLIIVADAGADPNYDCTNLGMVIRKCRTDFGIDIEIDTSQLKPLPDGASKWHCAIGTIRYDYVEPEAPVGTLVYIKPSLTGDESADVANYARAHPDFPHQPTLNQFYGESQFESYRQLGCHCLTSVMGSVAKRLKARTVTDPAHRDERQKAFRHLGRCSRSPRKSGREPCLSPSYPMVCSGAGIARRFSGVSRELQTASMRPPRQGRLKLDQSRPISGPSLG